MISVTVSSKYQVVIPKSVRESMGIVSGQKIQILTYQNRIELIPIKPMKEMRGFLEVFKRVMRQRGEDMALEAAAHMEQGKVILLDAVLAIDAAVYDLKYKLPLADSIIYATARKFSAMIWAQNTDFKALSNVKYFQKVKAT